MTKSFNCASCSAPLEFDGEMLQKCEHCGSTVIAPSELFYSMSRTPFVDMSALKGRALKIAEIRQLIHDGKKIEAIKVFREAFGTGLKEAKDAVEAIERGESIDISGFRVQTSTPVKIKVDGEVVKKAGLAIGGTMIAMFIIPIVIAVVVVGAVLFFTFGKAGTVVTSIKNSPTSTPAPGAQANEASPAQEILKIGGEGSGPGRFKDNRHVTIDGNGRIYSSDYSPIRIQVFDAEGKFIDQWIPEDGNNLFGMAADRSGNIYVASNKGISKHEGETGKLLAKAERVFPRDIAVTWDNKVIVSAGRAINIYDNSLKLIIEIKDAAERASTTVGFERIAADGNGNIYAVDRTSDDICKFAPDGKFLNRFPSGANSPNAIAIDPSGRIFVSDTSSIKVLDASGKQLTQFDSYQAFGMTFDQQGNLLLASRPYVVRYSIEL